MAYNTTADYSKVLGGKNLPFRVELDASNCIFHPAQGDNQRYRYTVTAQSGVSNTENLESIILGIDPEITADQIKHIAVTVNGSSRTVRFNVSGPNVRLNSSGLRFDFELNRYNGVMGITFELTATCEVGPIPVTLYGNNGDVSKTGLSIDGPCLLFDDFEPEEEPKEEPKKEPGDEPEDGHEDKKCFEMSTGKRFALKVLALSVPVSIEPVAITHKPEIRCLGGTRMEPGTKECHQGHESFNFTLQQKISVKTPVEFIVKTCYDKLCVEECTGEDETGEYEE